MVQSENSKHKDMVMYSVAAVVTILSGVFVYMWYDIAVYIYTTVVFLAFVVAATIPVTVCVLKCFPPPPSQMDLRMATKMDENEDVQPKLRALMRHPKCPKLSTSVFSNIRSLNTVKFAHSLGLVDFTPEMLRNITNRTWKDDPTADIYQWLIEHGNYGHYVPTTYVPTESESSDSESSDSESESDPGPRRRRRNISNRRERLARRRGY